MIRIAICDKEKDMQSYLSALVSEQQVDCEIRGYSSSEEYLADNQKFDLLFLDIKLQNPGDGLELAREIRNRGCFRKPLIIFITAYKEYVYDAFDVDAFQFLLKPVDEERFAKVFGRAVKQILTGDRQPKRPLVIQFAGASKAVALDSIYYVESQGHKVVLHMEGERLEYYAKLGALEQELYGQFFRIHKGYLVNLSFVDGYSKSAVTLSNGEKLLISKYKYADFVKAYLEYVAREHQ